MQGARDMTYDERATAFFESYFNIPKDDHYYIAEGVLDRRVYQELVLALLKHSVFECYKDVRRAALMEFDVVLPAKP